MKDVRENGTNRTIEHWRKTYEGLTGGENDYFLIVNYLRGNNILFLLNV